jgi:hypothetical protein
MLSLFSIGVFVSVLVAFGQHFGSIFTWPIVFFFSKNKFLWKSCTSIQKELAMPSLFCQALTEQSFSISKINTYTALD